VTRIDHNRKLLALERERDSLREANCRLRDKLLECAKECERCHGTGLVTIHFPGNEGVPAWDADDQPCEECRDIREVLGQ
jgi:hypothetical protein